MIFLKRENKDLAKNQPTFAVCRAVLRAVGHAVSLHFSRIQQQHAERCEGNRSRASWPAAVGKFQKPAAPFLRWKQKLRQQKRYPLKVTMKLALAVLTLCAIATFALDPCLSENDCDDCVSVPSALFKAWLIPPHPSFIFWRASLRFLSFAS